VSSPTLSHRFRASAAWRPLAAPRCCCRSRRSRSRRSARAVARLVASRSKVIRASTRKDTSALLPCLCVAPWSGIPPRHSLLSLPPLPPTDCRLKLLMRQEEGGALHHNRNHVGWWIVGGGHQSPVSRCPHFGQRGVISAVWVTAPHREHVQATAPSQSKVNGCETAGAGSVFGGNIVVSTSFSRQPSRQRVCKGGYLYTPPLLPTRLQGLPAHLRRKHVTHHF
jgi:hypothetical protein